MSELIKGLPPQAIPGLVIISGALFVWLLLSRFMRAWRKERLERIRGFKDFVAVSTKSPYKEPEESARADAEKNIDVRFSVIRVVLFVALALGAAALFLLPFLGSIPQTLLSFLIALAIAVVGVAARPLIENFISGIVLSFSKQLRVGDTVLLDAEHYGTVEDINPTHTVVKLWDWRRYVVPNSGMLQKEVISYTHKDNFLWCHVAFHVTPRADLHVVEKLAREAAKESSYKADFEEPHFWVKELLAGSTLCWVVTWAKNPNDAWYLRADIRRNLASRLRAAGIDTQLETHQVSMFGGPPPSD